MVKKEEGAATPNQRPGPGPPRAQGPAKRSYIKVAYYLRNNVAPAGPCPCRGRPGSGTETCSAFRASLRRNPAVPPHPGRHRAARGCGGRLAYARPMPEPTRKPGRPPNTPEAGRFRAKRTEAGRIRQVVFATRKLGPLNWARLPQELGTRQLAFVLGWHPRACDRACRLGRLVATRRPTKRGPRWQVDKDWLRKWMSQRITEAQNRGFLGRFD